MAAVTVGRWSMSAKTDLLPGNILMASAESIHTETTISMMGHTARSFSAFRSSQSVWSVGKRMLGEHGFSQPSDAHVNAVSEFYKMVDAAIPDDIRWAQGTCSIDVSTLHGPRLYDLRTFISQTYEDTTVNWLPHLEIKFVWLLNEVGRPIHTTEHWVLALAHGPIGKHIKWIKSSRTRLTFVAKTFKNYDRLRPILVALIANYHEILHQHLDDTFIPIVTVPDNPPFGVRMAPERRSDGAIELIVTGSVSTPTHSFFTMSWAEAATQFQQWTGEPYIIKSVGPHPALTRMVII